MVNVEHKPDGSRHFVYVIDDDVDDRALTVRLLKAEAPCAQIESCGSSPEALTYLEGVLQARRGVPSLVLMDLKMPEMSGDELLSRLRSLAPVDALPVVFFSSSDMPQDVERCIRAGGRSYVRKPIDYNEYAGAIHSIIDYWLCHNVAY